MNYETSEQWIEEKETASKKECLLICLNHGLTLSDLNQGIAENLLKTIDEKIDRESFAEWLGY